MGNLHYMASVEARLNVRIWLASWETFVLVVKNFLGNQRAENYAEHIEQCCHSEKMENPRWANKKNQENSRSNFSKIVGNLRLFPGKCDFSRTIPTFPRKSYLLSAKISDDLFFSHRLRISNFSLIFANDIPLFL